MPIRHGIRRNEMKRKKNRIVFLDIPKDICPCLLKYSKKQVKALITHGITNNKYHSLALIQEQMLTYSKINYKFKLNELFNKMFKTSLDKGSDRQLMVFYEYIHAYEVIHNPIYKGRQGFVYSNGSYRKSIINQAYNKQGE